MNAEATLTVVRVHHRAWTTTKDFDTAASLLAEDLKADLPVNAYATKAEFVEAISGFGRLVSRVDLLTECASDGEAVLIYDLEMAPLIVSRALLHRRRPPDLDRRRPRVGQDG